MKKAEVMRLFPAPILSATLLASWLMLVGTVSAGHVVLAGVLRSQFHGGASACVRSARGSAPGSRAPDYLIVLYDIVASALVVARQILGPEERIRPGFVWVPLAIRDPHGVASLASIITMTPGTLSVDLSPDRQHLLVHALHVDDPAALIASIKERYERPLMAIFEGERSMNLLATVLAVGRGRLRRRAAARGLATAARTDDWQIASSRSTRCT